MAKLDFLTMHLAVSWLPSSTLFRTLSSTRWLSRCLSNITVINIGRCYQSFFNSGTIAPIILAGLKRDESLDWCKSHVPVPRREQAAALRMLTPVRKLGYRSLAAHDSWDTSQIRD